MAILFFIFIFPWMLLLMLALICIKGNNDIEESNCELMVVGNMTVNWSTRSSLTGVVKEHYDIITLKESIDKKYRKFVWEGSLQYQTNPIKNILMSWKKFNITTEECEYYINTTKI